MGEAGYTTKGNTGAAAVEECYKAFESCVGSRHSLQEGGFSLSFVERYREGQETELQQQQQQQQQRGEDIAELPRLPVSSGAAAGGGVVINGGGPRMQDVVLRQPPSAITATPGALSISGAPVETTVPAAAAGGVVEKKKGMEPYLENGKRAGAPFLKQVTTLASRAARVRRFEQMTGQHFFTLLAVAFITGMPCRVAQNKPSPPPHHHHHPPPPISPPPPPPRLTSTTSQGGGLVALQEAGEADFYSHKPVSSVYSGLLDSK